MDPSKLTISPDTLRFQKMARGKKSKLRRQNIIDLINGKPYGTPISYTEFAAATQTAPSATRSLVRTMARKGIVSQDQISPYRITYRVNGPITTRKLLPPPSSSQDHRRINALQTDHRTEPAGLYGDGATGKRVLLGDRQQQFARVCGVVR